MSAHNEGVEGVMIFVSGLVGPQQQRQALD